MKSFQTTFVSRGDHRTTSVFLHQYRVYGHTFSESMYQSSKVANPAHGQLDRTNDIFLSPFAPERLVSRYGFGSIFPPQRAHLHTQAETGAYLYNSKCSRRLLRTFPEIFGEKGGINPKMEFY